MAKNVQDQGLNLRLFDADVKTLYYYVKPEQSPAGHICFLFVGKFIPFRILADLKDERIFKLLNILVKVRYNVSSTTSAFVNSVDF